MISHDHVALVGMQWSIIHLDTPIALEGDGVQAVVRTEWGGGADHPRRNVGRSLRTDGEVLADVERDPDGSVWLYFAVQTGLGEAVSALRVEGDSGCCAWRASRRDVLHLRRTTVDEERITAARIASASGFSFAARLG